uniref:Uncharacterized protein n=1 Tax=Hippocampus comes TaxID=109280 RepID=A0A3Q2YRG0_HIPCM
NNILGYKDPLQATDLPQWDKKMFCFSGATYPSFQFLDLLLATFQGQAFSLIQAVLQVFDCHLQVLLHPLQMRAGLNFHLIQVSLHLLLESQGIVPAPDFSIQSGLHGLDHTLAVPLDLFHLLILLRKLSVDLALDLGQFELNAKNLGLLVLECCLYKDNENKASF